MRNQLVSLVLATAVPLSVVSAVVFYQLIESERAALRRNLMVNAKTLASLVDNEIDTHTAIAATLAASPALQKKDFDGFLSEARQALEFVPGSWLAVSTPDGQMVLSTLKPDGKLLPKHPQPDIAEKAFSSHEPRLGDLVVGPLSQRLRGYVEVPVFAGSAPLFSISIALPPDRFLKLIQGKFTHGEVVGIIDRNRRFVARMPDNEARVGTLASEGWRGAIARAPEGWTESRCV